MNSVVETNCKPPIIVLFATFLFVMSIFVHTTSFMQLQFISSIEFLVAVGLIRHQTHPTSSVKSCCTSFSVVLMFAALFSMK